MLSNLAQKCSVCLGGLICSILPLQAQTFPRHTLAISGGLMTNEAYDLRATYYYYFTPHVGVGGSFGYYGQWYSDGIYEERRRDGLYQGTFSVSPHDNRSSNAYLAPSLSLQTPTLLRLGKMRIKSQNEIGLMLQLPLQTMSINRTDSHLWSSTSDVKLRLSGTWLFWQLRTSIEAHWNNHYASIGYGLSDFDIYSSRRGITYAGVSFNQFYPKKSLTHSIHISFGVYF